MKTEELGVSRFIDNEAVAADSDEIEDEEFDSQAEIDGEELEKMQKDAYNNRHRRDHHRIMMDTDPDKNFELGKEELDYVKNLEERDKQNQDMEINQ